MKGFILGITTACIIVCIVFGFKQCERQAKIRRAEHRELLELRTENEHLKSDTTKYRKDIKFYMQKAGYSEWKIEQYAQGY